MDRRLVEDEDRRVLRDGHRQEHELALAERQLAGVAAEQVPHAHAVDRRGDRRAIGRAEAADRVLVRQAPEGHHLLDGRRERQARQLRDDREAAGDGEAIERRDRGAGQLDRAGSRLDEAGDRSEQRRLAGPVRADEGDPVTALDGEVDVADRRPAAVGDGQALGLRPAPMRRRSQVVARRGSGGGARGRTARRSPRSRRRRGCRRASRAARSLATMRIAPNSAARGTTRRASGRPRAASTCGATSPTKPMSPETATAAAVASEARPRRIARSRRTSMPRCDGRLLAEQEAVQRASANARSAATRRR